jgi:hypothetical protein
MGARFVDPSSFTELTSATGVPKYRIFGAIVTNDASAAERGVVSFMRPR